MAGNYLTQKQALLLRYIRWHWWRYGSAPHVSELARGFEVDHSAIQRRLVKLEAAGFVERNGKKGISLKGNHADT